MSPDYFSSKEEDLKQDDFSAGFIKALENKVKALKNERRVLIRQRNDLQKQLYEAKNEVNKLRRPPLLIGNLVEVFSDDQALVKSSTGPTFFVSISSEIEREELKVGATVALNQRTFAIIRVLPTSQDPFVRGMEVEDRPTEKYTDVGGLEKQIQEVRETVELSLLKPHLFEKVGIDPPKGVLLFGPPGSGKTLIAKAVAHEVEATFISIIGSEFVQKYIGEGARLVRELFDFARKKAKETNGAIIFIDELDAIGSRRLDIATSGDREVQRTFMQLLSELDGFGNRGNIKVIAATNRMDILDPALLRPGRFDRIIKITLPNERARAEIFRIHTRRMSVDSSVNLPNLATSCRGASGADIKAMCTEAGMIAIREERTKVKKSDFVHAIDKVLGKKTKESSIFYG